MRGYHREWDRAHRPTRHGKRTGLTTREERQSRTEKRCTLCQTIKPLADFCLDPRKPDGHEYRCKKCYNAHRIGKRIKRPRRPDTPGPRKLFRGPGYIYVIRSAGCYKIGLSMSPKARLASIQTASPFPIETICIIATDNMLQLEMQLHEAFGHARKQGEWFDLTDADVEQILHMMEQ